MRRKKSRDKDAQKNVTKRVDAKNSWITELFALMMLFDVKVVFAAVMSRMEPEFINSNLPLKMKRGF